MFECVSQPPQTNGINDIHMEVQALQNQQARIERDLQLFADAVRRDLANHKTKLAVCDNMIPLLRKEITSIRSEVMAQLVATRTSSRETDVKSQEVSARTGSETQSVPNASQGLEQLRWDLDYSFEALRAEMASLRVYVEQSAEKAVLFSHLREKEKAISNYSNDENGNNAMKDVVARKALEGNNGNTAVSDTSSIAESATSLKPAVRSKTPLRSPRGATPHNTFTRNASTLGTASSAASSTASALLTEPGQEFKVNFDDTTCPRLGLVVSEVADGRVRITQVQNGAVAAWNNVHPWRTVLPGDIILTVNDEAAAGFVDAGDIAMRPGGLQLLIKRGTREAPPPSRPPSGKAVYL